MEKNYVNQHEVELETFGFRYLGTTAGGSFLVEVNYPTYQKLVDGLLIKNGLETYYRNMRAAIKGYRELYRLTQQQFADLAGLSRNYVSQIENGEQLNLAVKTVLRLLHVLSMPPEMVQSEDKEIELWKPA